MFWVVGTQRVHNEEEGRWAVAERNADAARQRCVRHLFGMGALESCSAE